MSGFAEIFDSITSMRTMEITWTDLVEIIILAFLIYHIMLWIKTTRAWALVKGFSVIMVFLIAAVLFEMDTILWIAGKIFDIGILAIVIVFQPELRRAFEQLGQQNIIANILAI